MDKLTQHLETIRKMEQGLEFFGHTDDEASQALTFFIGVGEKLASPGEIESKILEIVHIHHYGCSFNGYEEKEIALAKHLAHSLLTALTQGDEEGGGREWKIPNNIYMKWYHWLLYPFAKKFWTCDEGVYVHSFCIFGKIYITNIKY